MDENKAEAPLDKSGKEENKAARILFKPFLIGRKNAGSGKTQADAASESKNRSKPDLKLCLSSRSNQALAISIMALAVALVAYSNSGGSAADAFIAADSAYSERVLSVDDVLNKPSARMSEQQDSAPAESKPEQSVPAPAGVVFADENEFKQAVAEAIAELRRDEAAKAMEAKFTQFQNAQESVPYGKKIYGNPQARFIIQEFSDLECPFCKDFFSVPKEVADLSNGQVAVEWVHTPLSFHEPTATQEAIAAECVFEQKGNRAFWVAMQQIFDTTGSNGRGSKILARFVDDFGLDRDAYIRCINSQEMKDRIAASSQIAMQNGITGTPAVIITDRTTNRTKFLSGAQQSGALMQAIEDLNAESARETEVPPAEGAE